MHCVFRRRFVRLLAFSCELLLLLLVLIFTALLLAVVVVVVVVAVTDITSGAANSVGC